MKRASAIIVILVFIVACSTSSKNDATSEKEVSKVTNELSRRDQTRLTQYKIEGAKIYASYCQMCHQQDGKGLASLYPPLAGSDYLLEDLPRAACIIKNGQSNEIVVNGVTYNQMMPGNPITNLEIAEVLTFIGNSWGNEAGLTGVKDVEKWLAECEDSY